MIICPECGSSKSKVNSTKSDGTDAIKRWRHCCKCGNSWVTVEIDADLWKSTVNSVKTMRYKLEEMQDVKSGVRDQI